jgi:cellobiose phosphorylase
VVFAQVSGRERSVSGNRTEFIGRNGSLASPAAMRRKRLSGMTGAGLDPCAAIQTRIELAAGQTREIVFVFGAARDADEAHISSSDSAGARARGRHWKPCGNTGTTPWARCRSTRRTPR